SLAAGLGGAASRWSASRRWSRYGRWALPQAAPRRPILAVPSPTRLAGRVAGAALQVTRVAAGLAVDATFATAELAVGSARVGIEVASVTGGQAASTAGAVVSGSSAVAREAALT